jgi:predicted MFS family arabinose efflux permease
MAAQLLAAHRSEEGTEHALRCEMNIAHASAQVLGSARRRLIEATGGMARLQLIVILAAVLGLDAADKGTLSAVSGELEHAFAIGNTQMGLLVAVVSLIGAAVTLPMGILVDRLLRKRILIIVISTWAAAMILSGFATSYLYLLFARVALGAVTAASWPCVASLTGDFFPASERASIYGLITAGEMVGIGVGFFVSGEVSTAFGWRWSFFVMAVPALALAWVIWRYLPEPARGGQRWLETGGERRPSGSRQRSGRGRSAKEGAGGEAATAFANVQQQRIEPRTELILRSDPMRRSVWWVLGYLLRLPTFRLLLIASALVYYFFAGLRTFAMLYFTGHYHLSRHAVSSLVFIVGLVVVAGVVIGGRISEHLLRRGRLSARVIVPAVALYASVPLLGLGIFLRSPWVSVPLLALGAGALAAAVPPIDAARLDIVHPRLWGRGEGVRMTLRSLGEGGAPLLFGALSSWLGGGSSGLMWTFLIMLLPMIVAGSLAIPAWRTYPRDVATAAASVEAASEGRGEPAEKPRGSRSVPRPEQE